MKNFFFLIFVSLCSTALAEVSLEAPVPYAALLFEGRLDDTVGGISKELRRHIYVAGGLRWDKFQWRSELGFSNESSREGFVEIKVNSYELMNWALYVFNPGSEYQVYAGGGLGVSSHYIQTTVGASRRSDSTDLGFDLAVNFGLEKVWSHNIQSSVEARVYKLDEKKDPIMSGLLQIGYLFK